VEGSEHRQGGAEIVRLGTWEFTAAEVARMTRYEVAWLRRSEDFDAAGLTPYDIGPTPFFVSRMDPRCSFCLFVPERYDPVAPGPHPVIVAIHGTDRPAQEYRDRLIPFAEEHGCIVVAPLFPAGLTAPWEIESYKLMRPDEMRSDLILLDMLAMIAERFRVPTDRVLMHGFSGGGQFALRFFLLHPDRLQAVSIAAPGLVTLVDDGSPWWVGVGDLDERFGVRIEPDVMRTVRVHLVVGELDSYEVAAVTPEEPEWMPGANDQGRSRIDRLQAFAQGLSRHGVEPEFEVVPGAGHEGEPLLERAMAFFARVLDEAGPTS
jgi:pimeloyl-ACP methyl ester carboxylesterase